MVKDGRQAGFTLMEVLVALAVLGLLMAGLTQGTRFGMQAWRRQSDMLATRDQLDGIDRSLRELLSSAVLHAADDPAELAFTGQLPQSTALASRRADMSLRVNQHRLTLRWTPHVHQRSLGPPPPPAETVLIDGIDRIIVSYWRVGDSNSPGGWTEEWNASLRPQLVKIKLVFPPDDKRHWPDIIVDLLTSGAGVLANG